jgi:hypothetical protein
MLLRWRRCRFLSGRHNTEHSSDSIRWSLRPLADGYAIPMQTMVGTSEKQTSRADLPQPMVHVSLTRSRMSRAGSRSASKSFSPSCGAHEAVPRRLPRSAATSTEVLAYRRQYPERSRTHDPYSALMFSCNFIERGEAAYFSVTTSMYVPFPCSAALNAWSNSPHVVTRAVSQPSQPSACGISV